MALPKWIIIAILIISAFITVALILGLIPIYMRSSHKDMTTIATELTSTTKKIVSTMPVDHEEMSEAAMLTVETSYISIESDQVTSTPINPVTTTSTTTTSTTTSASNTNTTLTTTTTTVNAINTVPTIASTTTTNTVDSNQAEITTTTTTTALVGSDVPARITITKVLSSSETIPSDSAVNGSTEPMTSNSDDVSLFTKSISVLTTSATILSVSIIRSNTTEQTISSIDSLQNHTNPTSIHSSRNTNLLDLYTAYQTTLSKK